MFENVGEIVLLFWRTLLALPQAWRQRQKVFEQFFEIGNASLLMVCVLSFFIGAVIALQTGPILVERSLASAVGGVVGVIVGAVLTWIVYFLPIGLPATISSVWVLIGFGVSCTIGLLFGIYPAWKAANLDPIEALRYE